MTILVHTLPTTLEWREPVPRVPRFELHSGEDILATLALEPLCRTLAAVHTPEGDWTFQQVGVLNGTVHLREEGSEQDLAVFHPGLLGRGVLRFGNDVSFHWRKEPQGKGWSFRDEAGELLLTLRLEPPVPGVWSARTQAEVVPGPAGRSNPRLPLLAAFGWYLILQRA